MAGKHTNHLISENAGGFIVSIADVIFVRLWISVSEDLHLCYLIR